MSATPTMAVDGAARLRGWVAANLYVWCIGALSIVYLIARQQGAHVTAFITLSMLFSGLALVLLTGRDRAARTIALEPLSWVVGGAYLAMEVSYFLLIATVPPAEASVLIRMSVPVSLVIGATLLGRPSRPMRWAGAALITATIAALVVLDLDLTTQWPGVAFGLAAAVFVNVRSFASEFHPQNRAAKSVLDKLRVTGVLVLVTALALVGAILVGWSAQGVGAPIPEALLPPPSAFMHPPTLLLALLVGGALFTAMSYLQFSSVVAIGTESFLSVTVLIPVAVAILQYLGQAVGLIDAPAFNAVLVPVILLIIIGTMMVLRAR